MRDIPESEARALFSEPLLCEEPPDWSPLPLKPDTVMLSMGALHANGMSARLHVELLFTRSRKTKLVSYRFSVFRRQAWGLERAYQLHVSQSPRGVKDAHARPHEHMGGRRCLGEASWANWSFDEVLQHFCSTTNITFSPKPPHPEEFALKG